MKKMFTRFSLATALLLAFSLGAQAQVICNQYDYYYADIVGPPGSLSTDIYSVEFVGEDAILTPIIEDLPYGAHIAYNQINNLIYVVRENGDVMTLDPILGTLDDPVSPPTPMTHITTAVINEDGKLLIGDMVTNTIYNINLTTSPYTYTIYDTDDDISGGDLTWTNTGLYLASKPNGYLYSVIPTMPNVLMAGYVDNSVTGMATMADGSNVLISALGNSVFNEYEISGGTVTQVNSFNAVLNGEAFTMANGDLTSGCSSFTDIGEGCEDFRFYYINDNGPDVPTGTVMSGTIVGNDFVLTSLFQSGISGHLAVNKDNGEFYVLRTDRVKTFSSTGVELSDVTIPGNIGKITAAVWNPVNNMVYIGIQNQGKVYELDPTDGSHTLFADNLPVFGGDLMLNDANELFLVKRVNSGMSELYNITSGTAVYMADVAPSANGAAITANGGFIVTEGGGGNTFHVYDSGGAPIAVLNAVDNLGNPMTLVDGDMASGCMSDNSTPPGFAQSATTLTAYPNPTTGQAQIDFVPAQSGKSTLQIIDLNGRVVETILTKDVRAGENYRVHFDGSNLPNGIYITKLTTNTETVIEKIMIAH